MGLLLGKPVARQTLEEHQVKRLATLNGAPTGLPRNVWRLRHALGRQHTPGAKPPRPHSRGGAMGV